MVLEVSVHTHSSVVWERHGRLALLHWHPRIEAQAFTVETVADLTDVWDTVSGLEQVETIVLAGGDRFFHAGTDIGILRNDLQANAGHGIVAQAKLIGTLFCSMAFSTKQVVAWTRGPALGGGLELALAAHRIVASPASRFSFPETSLGIHPGLGGTQRAARRMTVNLAKWMIYSGAIVPADVARECGLVDAVVETDSSASLAVQAQHAVDALAEMPPTLAALSPRLRLLSEFFGQHTVAELLDPARPRPAEPELIRTLIQMRNRSPLALRMAERLLNDGPRLPLPAALELELTSLEKCLSYEDARIGVQAFGQNRPAFVGP